VVSNGKSFSCALDFIGTATTAGVVIFASIESEGMYITELFGETFALVNCGEFSPLSYVLALFFTELLGLVAISLETVD
jgi:hypothetical protein